MQLSFSGSSTAKKVPEGQSEHFFAQPTKAETDAATNIITSTFFILNGFWLARQSNQCEKMKKIALSGHFQVIFSCELNAGRIASSQGLPSTSCQHQSEKPVRYDCLFNLLQIFVLSRLEQRGV
jgi:hypothetical protein